MEFSGTGPVVTPLVEGCGVAVGDVSVAIPSAVSDEGLSWEDVVTVGFEAVGEGGCVEGF